jgi:carbamate kinase
VRIVIALGGNALLRRGQPMTAENQRDNVRRAAARIAEVSDGHELVIAHGNGPQVGLLALQAQAYRDVRPYPLDVLGAETEAMIGYVVEQELGNLLPASRQLATILTMVEVDPADAAFQDPTKFIGPVCGRAEAERLALELGWSVRPDGDAWRRVVPSPHPRRILEIAAIRHLVDLGVVVICAGGGGIPTVVDAEGTARGTEAVIDKDLAAALLAEQLAADLLVIATDVDGVYRDFGTPRAARVGSVTTAQLSSMPLPAGSMGPKVEAACRFVDRTGGRAVIGSLDDIVALVAGTAGTRVLAPVADPAHTADSGGDRAPAP